MPMMSSSTPGCNDVHFNSPRTRATHRALAHPFVHPSRHSTVAAYRPHLLICQCSSSTSSTQSATKQLYDAKLQPAELQQEQVVIGQAMQQQQQQQHVSQQRQVSQQQQGVLQQPAASTGQLLTCRRCFQRFDTACNTGDSCSFHPAMYTGGEVAKAIGFVRESADPEHQLGAVVGRTGLMRFWDCCGAADSDAPGCVSGHHVSFDEELNASMGWTE